MFTALLLMSCLKACGGDDGGSPPVVATTPASVTLAAVGPNAVSYWSDVATATANGSATVMSTAEESNPVFSVDLATVHVAMYDAATAIDGRYKPYAITPTATTTAGASIPAAIGAAAYGVLKVLYPDYSALYANAYTSFVASIPEGDAKVRGLAIGAEVATKTVALRANDGRSVTLAAYAPGTAPGVYNGPAIYRFAGSVKPFVLTSMSQFRPAGPPLLTSTTYAADYNEIKALGVATGSTRTAVQTDQALFWNEFPGTEFPRNFARLAQSTTNVADAARLLAFIYVVQADSTMACFEAKYVFNFWRPDAAITHGDLDGNDATTKDAAWVPEIGTPPHPEYPAGHMCYGTGFAETLNQFYGTHNITFAFDSTATNGSHTYATTDAFVNELTTARIAGGIHFRTATMDGMKLGVQVAQWTAQRFFQKN